jgi:hypothetical protein
MSTQHTPGPWKVREDYAGAMSVVSHDHFLARVGPPNTEQAVANARLIAAAPDLLAALQAAENQIIALSPKGYIAPALGAIHAAIAKATSAT